MSGPESPRTHFGYESVDEADKSRRVRGVFDSVASRYDLMNDLMSLGIHRAWKAYAVAVADLRLGDKVLDIAAGTGDLTRAFARQVGPAGLVVQTDINESMLKVGRDRLLDEGLALPTLACDAEALPFADGRFDLVSVAFGLRNMTHKERAAAGWPLAGARVLAPGGTVAACLRLVLLQHPAAPGPGGGR
jgi:demethylmenaquinone methyltransferase / 2-methoxy-6-polyprenyl-1,4-benzoquinol methylase